jgi:oxygen-dependent protoporphyrinogen oxidase
MVTGVYAGDVEQLSLPACFPRMADLEARSRSLILGMIGAMRRAKKEGRTAIGARLTSFSGGMQTLTNAYAQGLRDNLRLDAAVRSLSRTDDGWRVSLPGGDLDVDAVALCAPAPVQAQLLRPIDSAAADAFSAIPYAAVAVVHVGFRKDALANVPAGFGFLGASSEKLPILGAVFPSMIFRERAPDDHHLFTCMVGGVRDPQAVTLDDAALIARAREGLQRALGITAEPVYSRIVRWPRAIPQYTLGHLDRVAALDAAEQRAKGLYFGGNALRGVSVADCIKNATPMAERIVAGVRVS